MILPIADKYIIIHQPRALAQIRILKDITISYYLILPLDLGSDTVMSTRGKDRFALVSPIACVIVDSVFVHIFL